MKSIGRFWNMNDVFNDIAKRVVPTLAQCNNFEVDFKRDIHCPFCGEEVAIGLFYRINNQGDWHPVIKDMKCSMCRDKEVFLEQQSKALEELRFLMGERLTKEYFCLPKLLSNEGFNTYKETNNTTAVAKERAILFTKTFLESPDNCHNLLIMGNPGTGKTHLCTAVARNIKNKGFNVGFLTTGKLLSKIKETFQKGTAKTEAGILRDLARLDLLILDDLGAEAKGANDDWRKATIFEIVESRSGKPTIYTSNLTDSDLPLAVGERVFSRLYNNTKFVDLFTEDYRKGVLIK